MHEQMAAGMAQTRASGLRKGQRRSIVTEKQMYEGYLCKPRAMLFSTTTLVLACGDVDRWS